MVKARFSTDKDSQSITLRLTGHAGAADPGYDIICASATILVYTVAQTAKFMYDEGKLRKRPRIKLDPGEAVITMKPKAEDYAEALHTYFVAQVGYSLLEHNFPEYVNFESFGESEESS